MAGDKTPIRSPLDGSHALQELHSEIVNLQDNQRRESLEAERDPTDVGREQDECERSQQKFWTQPGSIALVDGKMVFVDQVFDDFMMSHRRREKRGKEMESDKITKGEHDMSGGFASRAGHAGESQKAGELQKWSQQGGEQHTLPRSWFDYGLSLRTGVSQPSIPLAQYSASAQYPDPPLKLQFSQFIQDTIDPFKHNGFKDFPKLLQDQGPPCNPNVGADVDRIVCFNCATVFDDANIRAEATFQELSSGKQTSTNSLLRDSHSSDQRGLQLSSHSQGMGVVQSRANSQPKGESQFIHRLIDPHPDPRELSLQYSEFGSEDMILDSGSEEGAEPEDKIFSPLRLASKQWTLVKQKVDASHTSAGIYDGAMHRSTFTTYKLRNLVTHAKAIRLTEEQEQVDRGCQQMILYEGARHENENITPGFKGRKFHKLMNLPKEVRNRIYLFVLKSDSTIAPHLCNEDRPGYKIQIDNASPIRFHDDNQEIHNATYKLMNLTRVSRQVRTESLPIFYSANTFDTVADTPTYFSRLEQLGRFHMIRNVNFVVHFWNIENYAAKQLRLLLQNFTEQEAFEKDIIKQNNGVKVTDGVSVEKLGHASVSNQMDKTYAEACNSTNGRLVETTSEFSLKLSSKNTSPNAWPPLELFKPDLSRFYTDDYNVLKNHPQHAMGGLTAVFLVLRQLSSTFITSSGDYNRKLVIHVPGVSIFDQYKSLVYFPSVCEGLGIRLHFVSGRKLCLGQGGFTFSWHQRYQKKDFTATTTAEATEGEYAQLHKLIHDLYPNIEKVPRPSKHTYYRVGCKDRKVEWFSINTVGGGILSA
ncbi:hypothetical protein N0V90_003975 [Kalmusia sp. IMI 367209]|nr:hypothetical protein N0V90_003975 [Kalmusia sp. IMI 367209]